MFQIALNLIALLFSLLANILNASSEGILKPNNSLTIGIICALPGESGSLLELMEASASQEKGQRTYHRAKLHGIDTIQVARAQETKTGFLKFYLCKLN